MNKKSTNTSSNHIWSIDFPIIRFIALGSAIMFIGLTLLQLGCAYKFQGYVSVPAYIDNVSSREILNKKGVRTEYTFDVHWTYEGQEHVSTRTSSIDPPDYDLSEVRVNPNTGEMTLGSTKGSLGGAILTIVISGIGIFIWLILFLFSKNRSEEVDENCGVSIAMGIVGLPITLLCTYATCSESKYSSSIDVSVMLDIIFAIALIAGIIIKILNKKNLEPV